MPFFAVDYTYTTDAAALDEARPAHRAYLSERAAVGELVASGPYVGANPGRALLNFRAPNEDTVADWLSHDPFQQAGLVVATAIAHWNPVIGILADQLD